MWTPVALRAGYINGRYAWTAAHPEVEIDVDGSQPTADVLDVETGDATPAAAVAWIRARKVKLGNGAYPGIIYCNRSTLTPLFDAMEAVGYGIVRDFRLWIATLDGTEKVADMTGVVAVQAWGAGSIVAGWHNIDVSIVYENTWKAGKNMSFTITTPPPGTWEGEVQAVGVGTDGEKYATVTTDGVTWTPNPPERSA
jgi:hypothetical protein